MFKLNRWKYWNGQADSSWFLKFGCIQTIRHWTLCINNLRLTTHGTIVQRIQFAFHRKCISISRSYQHQFLIQLRSISRNSNRFEVWTKKFFSLNNFPWFGRTESRNLLFEIAHCWLLKLPIETAYETVNAGDFFLLWKHVGSRQFADMKEMLEKFVQVLPIYIHCKTKKLKPATRAPMINHPDATRQKKKNERWKLLLVEFMYIGTN